MTTDKIRNTPFINSNNARELAALAHESRKLNLAAKALNGGAKPDDSKPLLEAYRLRQLVRIRDKLDKLDKVLDDLLLQDVIDCQAIERASRALATLSDLERVLCGRPLPGTDKPSASKPRQSNTPVAPIVSGVIALNHEQVDNVTAKSPVPPESPAAPSI